MQTICVICVACIIAEFVGWQIVYHYRVLAAGLSGSRKDICEIAHFFVSYYLVCGKQTFYRSGSQMLVSFFFNFFSTKRQWFYAIKKLSH